MRESELLANIAARSAGLNRAFPQVAVGPGDDCAVVRLGEETLLLTVDQVLAGRHFRTGTPLDLIARKAIARSISDIAAMAGTPLCALATGALPMGFPQAEADALFEAMKKWAEHWKCPLVGGDIASLSNVSDPMMLTVTVLGVPDGKRGALLRSGALAGDNLYITGSLGGSFDEKTGLGKHLTFEPRIAEAKVLAGALGDRLHAMMDISDGLGRDAGRMAKASGVRLEIDSSAIPKNAGTGDWKRAVGEGEDYELLFAAAGSDAESIRLGGVPITRVGRVVAGSGCFVHDGGQLLDASELGWEHS